VRSTVASSCSLESDTFHPLAESRIASQEERMRRFILVRSLRDTSKAPEGEKSERWEAADKEKSRRQKELQAEETERSNHYPVHGLLLLLFVVLTTS
jgi:hypothetical protein